MSFANCVTFILTGATFPKVITSSNKQKMKERMIRRKRSKKGFVFFPFKQGDQIL
jgi:hypothetical protein